MKEKISIDLDVITVGIWKKIDKRKILSEDLMKRIENKEFQIITVSPMLNLVKKWRNKKLAGEIKDFYSRNSDFFIDEAELFEKLKNKKIDVSKLLNELSIHNIKDEDVILIIACAVEQAKLITFNRKHLKNKQDKIKEVLKKYGLKIDILYPNEI